jgi:hypothetical protein
MAALDQFALLPGNRQHLTPFHAAQTFSGGVHKDGLRRSILPKEKQVERWPTDQKSDLLGAGCKH